MKTVFTLFVAAAIAVGCSASDSQDTMTTDASVQETVQDIAAETGTDAGPIPDPGTSPDLGTETGFNDQGPEDPGTIDPGPGDPGTTDMGPTDTVTQDTCIQDMGSDPGVGDSSDPGSSDQGGVEDACNWDPDCDGIDSDVDNCPTVYNPDQTDTCNDGVGDACSDDNDCDGVGAAEDNCPLVYNPLQKDNDSDMVGDECDPDDDNDLDPDDTDCDPFDPAINHDAEEVCNEKDDDCDGDTDEDGVCCEPDCENKDCGGDGCGGSCGECAYWEECDVDQLCVKFPSDIEFRLPAAPESIEPDPVVYVDHEPGSDPNDPLGYKCIAFDGSEDFPNCYDEHLGSDFMIVGFDMMEALSGFPTAFAAMDEGHEVLAAADGEVVAVVDGNYDRCHLDIAAQGISCDGYPMASNHVTLLHDSGYTSEYHHMMKDSIVVTVGQQVSCGDKLGLIGSSGYSTSPHIHFEVHGPMDAVVDPYAGIMSQQESYWVDQEGPYGLPSTLCEGE